MLNRINVSVLDNNLTLFIKSSRRKSYYNLSSLHKILNSGVFEINNFLYCHLITFPYISVVVESKGSNILDTHKEEVIEYVANTLWNELKK